MNVDEDALQAIRVIRAKTDPILVYSPTDGLSIATEDGYNHQEDGVPEILVEERVHSIEDLSSEAPRRVATWGDTSYHLQESSLHHSMFVRDHELALGAIYAFEQFMESQGLELPGDRLSWDRIVNGSDQALNETLNHTDTDAEDISPDSILDTVETIRHVLAREQNRLFANVTYQTLPDELKDGVPKAFWEQPDPHLDELRDDDDAQDNNSQQMSLDGF